MSQDDFNARLARLSNEWDGEPEFPSEQKPAKSGNRSLLLALLTGIGLIGLSAIGLWPEPANTANARASAGSAEIRSAQPMREIVIENGVPYKQIRPNTPIMQRLPEKKGIIGMLLSNTTSAAIDSEHLAPAGWLRVSNADVDAVTPMQQVYLALDDFPPQVAVVHRLALDTFAKKYTGTADSGSNIFTGGLTGVPDGALYLSSSGGYFGMTVSKFRGTLVAVGQETQSSEQDSTQERFERQKFDGGSRRKFIDVMVNGVTAAVVNNSGLDADAAVAQIENGTGFQNWYFFIMPDYNTMLTISGKGSYEEFALLVDQLGVPFPQD